MSQSATFKPRGLSRAIAVRGLTPEQFAEAAGLNRDTVYRALKGARLKPGSFASIIRTLGATPVIDLPDDLVKSA